MSNIAATNCLFWTLFDTPCLQTAYLTMLDNPLSYKLPPPPPPPQDEWAASLRSEVSTFVRDMASGAGSPCRLVQLYLSRDLLARQAHHLLVRSHDRLLETQRHYKRLRRRHLRLQDDYRCAEWGVCVWGGAIVTYRIGVGGWGEETAVRRG